MKFTAKMYDSAGNEVEVKPGHAVVMGQHVMIQVPIDQYEAEMIYKPATDCERAQKLMAEWGGAYNVLFPSSNGELKRWEDLNEEVHDGDARDTQ